VPGITFQLEKVADLRGGERRKGLLLQHRLLLNQKPTANI